MPETRNKPLAELDFKIVTSMSDADKTSGDFDEKDDDHEVHIEADTVSLPVIYISFNMVPPCA